MNRVAGSRWSVLVLGVLAGALSHAQAIVGRTAGQSSVTPAGAARYDIPLTLPPGTNGLTPALAVTYDSRSGNGLLGVGFRLAGASVIQRCGSTLVQDGRIGAVALDWPDRFCLDGQRLRLTSGVYGQAGSRYQTESETFSRVTAIGTAGSGPAAFKVERLDGLTYEYGTTADSRVESLQSATPREWALSRIIDRSGNHADFVYSDDPANGSHRLLRIDYSGNAQTGATPAYSVRFQYENRPAGEGPAGYLAGGPVAETTRLDRIDVIHVRSGGTVRSFDLSYGAPGPTGRSRLAALHECAGGACLAPTQFAWTSVPAGWSVNMAVTLPNDRYTSALPGDLDGDGFDDLSYHDTSSRTWMILRGGPSGFQYPAIGTGLGSDSDAAQAILADVDGNGRLDVLVPGSGNYWHWLRRTSGGAYAYSNTGVVNPAPPGGLVAADIDGDGRDDLVYVKTTGSAIFWRRSLTAATGNFAAEAVLWTVPAGTRLPAAPFVETAQRFRSIVRNGDMNGDGRTDLLVRTQQGSCGTAPACATWVNRWQVLASNGTTLVPQHAFDGNAEALLADFNADGLTDIAYWTTGSTWQLLHATGSRLAVLAGFHGPLATAAAAPPIDGRTMVIDWDADGRTDLLQSTSSGELQYCRSTGRSLEPCLPAGISPGTVPASPMTLDVNGDSYADVMYATAGVKLLLHQQVPPDKLVSATDGLGAASTFEYAPLSNGTVHRAGTAAVFPVRDHVRPGLVVSRATRTGTFGSEQETFLYEGARMHVQGRGFLGFARRTVTPTSAALVRVEEYLQDPAAFERVGFPARITVQQRSGAPVARTTYSWAQHTYGTGQEARRFSYPASVVSDRFELDGVLVSSTTTSSTRDTFGTLVQQREVTTERAKGLHPGAQHTQLITVGGVVNDAVNWCLGRPSSTQVTRSHSLAGGAAVTRSHAHSWDYVRCRPIQQVVEPASSTLRVTTDVIHDQYGNPSVVSVTPVGQPARTMTYTWGQDGRLLSAITNPEGHRQQFAWDDAAALPVASIDANGLGTLLQYDAFGRVARETRPDGTTTTFTRTACGAGCPLSGAQLVVTATRRGVGDAHIAAVETGHDRFGREVYSRHEQPGGAFTFRVRQYNSIGLLARESIPASCCAAPARWISYAYDSLGRLISLDRPSDQANSTPIGVRWRHDGLSVTETDPLGRATTRRFDARGSVLQVVDPALADTDYEYDAFGNLVRTRDALGVETSITYDVRGLRRSVVDAAAGRWTYDYFPLGEVRSQTNARGQKTTYAYDRLGRPVSRAEPEGTTTWTWGSSATAYNIGSLASVAAPGFQESYQYDARGRPIKATRIIAGSTLVTSQTFNAVTGAPDTFTYPASTGTSPLRVRYHFDRDRLIRVSDADSAQPYWQLSAVDVLGQPTDETLGNGVRVVSAYDAVTGRLLTRASGPGGGTSLQNLAFAWDPVGNLLRREERNRDVHEQFTYDLQDRLDHVQRGSSLTLDLAYDATGNITSKSDVGSYRYDTTRKHAVVAAGANTYTYDANGAVANASGTTIAWLSFDLPSQISHPGGNYSSFQYGADRMRFRQVARAAGVVTETLYAAGGLYERVTTGSDVSFRHYIVADGRRVAVHTRKAGAAPTNVYLLEDHLGGVDGFTSATGTLLARTSYQPFGARRAGDGLSGTPTSAEWQQIRATTARGYTGHEHLDNLGLIHMNGRIYDPALGRFLSPDPVVQVPYDTQGTNRYAYVRNNPLRYTDPSGFCFGGGPVADYMKQPCLENILVQVFAMRSWQLDLLLSAINDSALSGIVHGPAGGSGTRPPVDPGDPDPSSPPGQDFAHDMEEIVVFGQRLPQAEALSPVAVIPQRAPSLLGTLSGRSLAMFGAAAGIAGLLASPAEISSTSELRDDQGEPRDVYHFTNDTGKRGISTTGVIMPGQSGLVYVSPIPYSSASQAQSALSLPRSPTGYFSIPRQNIPSALTWSVVAPNFGQAGGGLEASVSGSVSLEGASWYPIRP